MTASGPSVDYGLPCLTAEVSFWQSAFGLDDWTIKARHVDDLRCPRDPRERLLGVVNACSLENRTAEIRVRTPRTTRDLRTWPEIVCHEMMHVLCAAYRGRGWTMAKEHALIYAAAPILARLKRADPKTAARIAGEVARGIRDVWPLARQATTRQDEPIAALAGHRSNPLDEHPPQADHA